MTWLSFCSFFSTHCVEIINFSYQKFELVVISDNQEKVEMLCFVNISLKNRVLLLTLL